VRPENPNTFRNTNSLVLGETILGILSVPSYILFGVTAFILFASVWLWKSSARPFATGQGEDGGDEDGDDAYSLRGCISSLAILMISKNIGVSFSLHYVIQTRPRTFVLSDSFGNLQPAYWQLGQDHRRVYTGDSANGTSWSDFFLVQTPTDRLGFYTIGGGKIKCG
jgi:hypothetical protein